MERHETLHFSYSPALIKLDVEKVSALSGGFQITSDLKVGVTVEVTENVYTGNWEPSIGTLNGCILNEPRPS